VFILNNEWMGMVRQWQELTYESRYSKAYSDSLPDFVKLAEAYGWKGIRIENESQLDAGIQRDDRPSRPGDRRLPRRRKPTASR
jgi:acetolactate synthase-1/2/3 large subunit